MTHLTLTVEGMGDGETIAQGLTEAGCPATPAAVAGGGR